MILCENYRLEVANPVLEVPVSSLKAEIVLGVLFRKGGGNKEGTILTTMVAISVFRKLDLSLHL